MARLLDDASSEYLKVTGMAESAWPITMAGWFKSDDISNNNTLMMLYSTAGAGKYLIVRTITATSKVNLLMWDGATAGNATTTVNFTTGSWHHVAAVSAGASSRAAYIDGGGKGTGATALSAWTDNSAFVVGREDLGGIRHWSGDAAEIGLWAAELSDAEVLLLSQGRSPLVVQPDKLIGYWPLIDNADLDLDWTHRWDLTAFNTPSTSTHPDQSYPRTCILHSREPARTIPLVRHRFVWRSDVKGHAEMRIGPEHRLRGRLVRFVTRPEAITGVVPENNYDLRLRTGYPFAGTSPDLLNSLGTNRSSTTAQAAELYLAMSTGHSMRPIDDRTPLTLDMRSAGMNRGGSIDLYMCEDGLDRTPHPVPVRPAGQGMEAAPPGRCCGYRPFSKR